MSTLIRIWIVMIVCIVGRGVSSQSLAKSHVPSVETPTAQYFSSNRTALGIGDNSEMRLVQKIAGKHGASHLRYQQLIDEVPVWAAHYIVHDQGGIVDYSHGTIVSSSQQQVAHVSELRAFEIAKAYLGDLNYSWEQVESQHAHESVNKFNNRPVGNLNYVCQNFPKHIGSYDLMYVFDILTVGPEDRQFVMVDAVRGKINQVIPAMAHHALPSTGETYYYGTQSFISDSVAPDLFQLIDQTRGRGVLTLDGSYQPWTHGDRHWDFLNSEDASALDAHYGATLFYDMMLQQFNWEGLDNQGKELISVLSATHYVNASWNGQLATFGRGDCNHSPLTPLEIVGHEFMHGVTEFSAGLIYRRESGAINESMSDVFGKALEYYKDVDNFSWDIGHAILSSVHGESFRSFSDPHLRNDPKYYGGEYWSDFGGVHTNSSIGNHWFYVMITGGEFTNELNEKYIIQPIPWDDLLPVVFDALTQYLMPTSNYLDYRQATLEIAKKRFGEYSTQYKSIEDAWNYVGVLEPVEDQFELSLEFIPSDTSFCTLTGTYEPTVRITNTGQIRIPNGNPVYLTYDGLGQVNISQAIEVGEVVDVLLPNALELADVNQYDYFYATVHAPMFDFEADGRQLISVATEVVDFGVSNFNMHSDCSGALKAEFLLGFYSCDQRIEDPIVQVEFSDSDGSFTEYQEIVVPRDLTFRQSFSLEIPLNATIATNAIPTFRIITPGDPANNNAATDPDFLFRTPTFDGFVSDFSLGAIPELFFIRPNLFYGNETYVEYEGQHYILAYADRTIGSLPCADVSNDGVAYSDIYEMCIDASDLLQPVLSFDLRQYRTIFDIPDLAPYTVQLLVSWMDDGELKTLEISDQLEGVTVTHEIELPSGFSDEITFYFYNFNYNRTFNFPVDIDSADLQLLNNITLTEAKVAIEDVAKKELTIYPNPSYNVVTVVLPPFIDQPTYHVFNLQGQQVLSGELSIQSTIDVSKLSTGCYFISMTNSMGEYFRNKIVIQRGD